MRLKEYSGITVLPVGGIPPPNPAELLSTPIVERDLLRLCSSTFDYVIMWTRRLSLW